VGELKRRQRAFVGALLVAPTIKQAAECVGVTERTARRWWTLPEVQAELRRLQEQELSAAARQAVLGMGEALGVLREIVKDRRAPRAHRISAARAVLAVGLRVYELHTLAERVAALEDALGGEVRL
jgi:hypothetical protein